MDAVLQPPRRCGICPCDKTLTIQHWLMLGQTGLGAVVLVWLSLGALRGRIDAALMADQNDMG